MTVIVAVCSTLFVCVADVNRPVISISGYPQGEGLPFSAAPSCSYPSASWLSDESPLCEAPVSRRIAMSMPPQVGPNANLLLQRLDLIEKKIDWIAQRVTWLTYTVGTPVQPGAEPSQAGKSTTHASPMGTVDTNETTEVAANPGDDVASPTAAVSPAATMSLKASAPVANHRGEGGRRRGGRCGRPHPELRAVPPSRW